MSIKPAERFDAAIREISDLYRHRSAEGWDGERALAKSRMVVAKLMVEHDKEYAPLVVAEIQLRIASEAVSAGGLLSESMGGVSGRQALYDFANRLRAGVAAAGITVHECDGGNDGAPPDTRDREIELLREAFRDLEDDINVPKIFQRIDDQLGRPKSAIRIWDEHLDSCRACNYDRDCTACVADGEHEPSSHACNCPKNGTGAKLRAAADAERSK